MFKHLSGGQLASLSNLDHLVISEADDHVLGLEVGVDNFAHTMHVVESDETLAGELAHERKRDSLVIIALDDLEEVYA